MDGLRRDAARNRSRIVEAARTLILEGEPIALNAVARAADVGVGTVYRHFATVEELEEALVWERFDELAEVLRDAGPASIDQVLTAHFLLLAEDALFEKVVSRAEPALERTSAIRTDLIGGLTALMDGARRQGMLRADIDAEQLLLLVCGLAHSVRSVGVSADSPASRTLLRVVLDGLRPHTV